MPLPKLLPASDLERWAKIYPPYLRREPWIDTALCLKVNIKIKQNFKHCQRRFRQCVL